MDIKEMSRRQKKELKEGLIDYVTESLNKNSIDIDLKSTEETLHIINEEDKKVAYVIEKQIPQIKKAVELLVDVIKNGGKVFYIGAGTDGRLGVVDAAECPPTFGTDPQLIQAIMAGGKEAVFRAREGIEDEGDTGTKALLDKSPAPKDVLVGISADGRQDFVLDAIYKAKEIGMKIIVLTHNPGTEMEQLADVAIVPIVGPEVMLGSTRMKVGLAQKMILTMMSTTAMIKLGRTYSNLMINIKSNNNKLIERAKKLVMIATGVDYDTAEKVLDKANKDIKTTIIMIKKKISFEDAIILLKKADGIVRKALEITA